MERVKAARIKIEDEINKLAASIPANDRALYHDPLKKLV